ncbi:MAG TPA: hypothetical protein VGM91_12115 [Conexibacter sp.]
MRIGVTGHRNLANADQLAAEVRLRLRDLHQRFPSTATTPVCFAIRSSLAEGADRLVVHEALRELGTADVKLHAILPNSPEEYVRDFRSRESVAEFRELLARAVSCSAPPGMHNRDVAYEHAGRGVVDESDLVIALWDGRHAAGRAGTEEVVRYAGAQGVPVIVVPTTRAGQSEPPEPVSEAPDLAVLQETYRRTLEFNGPALDGRVLRKPLNREQRRLAAAVNEPHHAELVEWSAPRFVRADVLAMKYQRRHYRLADALYGLAALAVMIIAAQSQAKWSPEVAFLEVGAMLAVLTAFALARSTRVHDRWMGYRSLAEAFRSAPFITATATTPSDSATSSLTGAHWFQHVFSEAWGARPRNAADPSRASTLSDFLLRGWIEEQISYHERAAVRLRRARSRVTAAVLALFAVTVAVGVLHAFEAGGEESSWGEWFTFLALSLPAVGGALCAIRDQRQYRIHEERSDRVAARLRQLRDELKCQSDLATVKRLSSQVQAAIDAEKQDWLGVSEFQDLELAV